MGRFFKLLINLGKSIKTFQNINKTLFDQRRDSSYINTVNYENKHVYKIPFLKSFISPN